MEANLTPKLSPVPPSTQGVDSSICMNNTDKSISCNQSVIWHNEISYGTLALLGRTRSTNIGL